jgi:hypothetical protein
VVRVANDVFLSFQKVDDLPFVRKMEQERKPSKYLSHEQGSRPVLVSFMLDEATA